ncbi:hypothetical protein ACS72_16065 [Acinetobacter sp. VT 511]|nr:hypothetical protein ACS72_16065 [Acinetobacter sp. VT 511]
MSRGQEPSLIFGWSQVNAAVQHVTEKGSEQLSIRVLSMIIIRNRMITEMGGERTTNPVDRQCNAMTVSRSLQTCRQVVSHCH